MAKDYGDTSIKTLDPVTHIRMRPGMYVGEPGTGAMYHDCIYILMKEVIDNSVDEFVMGQGKRIDVNVNYDTGETSVRDYGRGIPLGKVVDCVSQMNTGGKFNSDSFQFSAGMNGVGTKAVNALSSFFEVRSFRDGEMPQRHSGRRISSYDEGPHNRKQRREREFGQRSGGWRHAGKKHRDDVRFVSAKHGKKTKASKKSKPAGKYHSGNRHAGGKKHR